MVSWLASGVLANQVEYRFANRHGGVSSAPYQELNIANWVGDLDSSVQRNIELIEQSIGKKLHLMNPEHGVTAQDVLGNEKFLKKADILITTQRQVVLAAPSADCVSLILTSRQQSFLMMAHIGWRGAAQGIAKKITSICSLYGVSMSDTSITMGPAICGGCYEVSRQVHDEVVAELPDASHLKKNFVGIDLRAGLQEYFRSNGAEVENNLPCTMESGNMFSYRRDNKTGRQATLAWLI